MRALIISLLSLPLVSSFLTNICRNYHNGTPEYLFCQADANGRGYLLQSEFSNIFMSFDVSSDRIVTKHEFEAGWRRLSLPLLNQAGFFFTIVDMNEDLHIDQSDLDLLFKFFDDNGGSTLTMPEFTTNWNVLFRF